MSISDGTVAGTDERNRLSVSVVMIVKNGERLIGEALDSIFQSKIKPAEVLVVDGGSDDRTTEIARSFPLVRIIAQTSSGIAAAYNEGIDLTRGELVAFLSHDDLWTPGKLDIQVAFMVENPDLLYTVGMVQHVLVPGTVIPPGFREEMLARPQPGLIMETLVARRSIFDVVGRFDPSFPVSEDTDWFARATDAGVRMAILPDVLLLKRVHNANASLTEPKINKLLLRALRNSIARKKAATGGNGDAE